MPPKRRSGVKRAPSTEPAADIELSSKRAKASSPEPLLAQVPVAVTSPNGVPLNPVHNVAGDPVMDANDLSMRTDGTEAEPTAREAVQGLTAAAAHSDELQGRDLTGAVGIASTSPADEDPALYADMPPLQPISRPTSPMLGEGASTAAVTPGLPGAVLITEVLSPPALPTMTGAIVPVAASGGEEAGVADMLDAVDNPMVILPGPLVTTQAHPHLSQALATRLDRFATYANPASCCFAISQIPATVSWGNVAHASRDAEYLTVNNRRLSFWMVAELVASQFYRDGAPARRVSIQVRPLIASDDAKVMHMLTQLAHPVLDAGAVNGVWLARWNAPWGAPDSAVKVFNQLYDATETFQAKSQMPHLLPGDFAAGDLVLVEGMCIRWRDLTAAQKKSNPQYRTGPWTSWRVELRLDAMSLLSRGDGSNTVAAIDEHVQM